MKRPFLSPLHLSAPMHLFSKFNEKMPLFIKRSLIETPLNSIFDQHLYDDEFEILESRYITLHVTDIALRVTLSLRNQSLQIVDRDGDVVISGTLESFIKLAKRTEDADSLFFQRQLKVEGDTELGLGIKNLLDSLEWGIKGQKYSFLLNLLNTLFCPQEPALKQADAFSKR